MQPRKTGREMSNVIRDEQGELLALTKGADSIELKISVPDDDHSSVTLALGLDPIEAEIRQVYFFDTPDLALDASGLVVRARRIQGGTADTVIKLRPVVPDELPKHLRRSESMKVEVDLMPGQFVASASMKGKADPGDVQKAAAGKLALKKLFSNEQKEFFKMNAPDGMKLGDLVPLGPILTLKLTFPEKELGRELVAEAWFYPDNSRILELSTKCMPKETFQVAAETKNLLAKKGVDFEAEQKTKTKTALQYFSKHLVQR
jgi:hypothetical protein